MGTGVSTGEDTGVFSRACTGVRAQWGTGVRRFGLLGGLMNGRWIAATAIVAALVFGGASAAFGSNAPVVAQGTATAPPDYTPDEPTEPTLAGSTVVPACAQDVPWLTYRVQMIDPEARATGNTARLVLTDGANSVTLTLGTLGADGTLSGRILWPGATIGADGRGTGWPGWETRDGALVETTGNYAWTRGNITATIEVNPSIAVAVSYPPATPQCATGPRTQLSAAGLPATGGSTQTVLIAGTVGALGLALGITAVVVRRRRRV